jgi:hypothetical protein
MASVTKSYNNMDDDTVEMEVDIADIVLETTENPLISFDFISDEFTRIMIETAYQAVNQLELWDYLRGHHGSFMYSSNRNVEKIYRKIEELGYYGHSGASFGITLQMIKYIADHGFEAFKNNYLK